MQVGKKHSRWRELQMQMSMRAAGSVCFWNSKEARETVAD